MPVLTKEWPDAEPFDGAERDRLRRAHADWQASGDGDEWITSVLRELLGCGDAISFGDFASLALEVHEHEAVITLSFTLTDPASGEVRLLGLVSDDSPVGRVRGSDWPATPADRLAQLCRARGVELGLANDGRWWALVWAPTGGVATLRFSTRSLGRILLNGPWFERSSPCLNAAAGSPCRRRTVRRCFWSR